MMKTRRSFLKESATATASATVFAGLINTPGIVGAQQGATTGGTTAPVTTVIYFILSRTRSKTASGSGSTKAEAYSNGVGNWGNTSFSAWSAPSFTGGQSLTPYGWTAKPSTGTNIDLIPVGGAPKAQSGCTFSGNDTDGYTVTFSITQTEECAQ